MSKIEMTEVKTYLETNAENGNPRLVLKIIETGALLEVKLPKGSEHLEYIALE